MYSSSSEHAKKQKGYFILKISRNICGFKYNKMKDMNYQNSLFSGEYLLTMTNVISSLK